MEMAVKLPDGSIRQYDRRVTVSDVAESISKSLLKKAVAGKIDGKVVDLNREVPDGAQVQILTLEDKDGVEVYRHSTAHLLAQALKRLYPDVKLGIGPVIEDGFYYDVDLPVRLTPEDFPKIEAEMNKIVKENLPIVRKVVSREEAIRLYEKVGDHLKLEIIRDLPEDAVITIYEQGEFFDLCRGPHLPSTGKIKAFKLLSVAGAYWRGDSDNQMLQRIYGTAWPKKSELEEYLHFLEEARKRDHRKLGRELKLYMFSEEAPGMPFYLPNGMTLRNELEQLSREMQTKAGYKEVRTPLMMNQRLWEQSGHWDHYRENMYFTDVDEATFAVKPMNCPGHMLIFKNEIRSYRDLPLRLAEFGQVHRHELSGALNGMLRVRTFTQDDAHIFVRPDQIEEEVMNALKLIDQIYSVFGFPYSVELSTRPEDSMGSDELWEKAESALKSVLDRAGIDYRINEGDGAFYGPKIDFHIRDALKRSHQCATIQLDFQMPEKFDLSYIGEDNERHRPVVIHRAIYGSIDRFIGILVEHYGGAFPLWLAPVQVRVIPVSRDYNEYARKVTDELQRAGIRVELDARDEKVGYKIREAQVQKVPYMFVVGEKELNSGTVAVRKRTEGDLGAKPLDEVIRELKEEIGERR
ncbi:MULTISPECIES: threonine--tRNA ligase [Thermoactinomyces]|jgi:threonyl-tRNA synthetase|uniref:Threonine--tRNA ligase n=1 Tax=Thermoactinomyces daqus TaxID=1329516 RepID=A0A7W1X7M6_9BACL|nr:MULTISPECIES: threonine--tRNA ligase [Thermoactinomyces]MBA4541555.1 threonine--tRNA ligase [Thermoactinomyces daqus]MBH8597551.1 threonine--tRNA ligase [Thermoactinomyces sp. CICC 10523]MBH8603892.1 threonine--tRNA ligase [Thermoactinomyces sp. CICC 10522]MBH8606575.1 threonine--tRNA ligase [Thermoactinomyces sp. CICC 10521]